MDRIVNVQCQTSSTYKDQEVLKIGMSNSILHSGPDLLLLQLLLNKMAKPSTNVKASITEGYTSAYYKRILDLEIYNTNKLADIHYAEVLA